MWATRVRDPERSRYLALAGPGIVLAATGVGAVLKWVMGEGLARWQLATGTTLLQGWTLHLGRWVQYVFLAYLVGWPGTRWSLGRGRHVDAGSLAGGSLHLLQFRRLHVAHDA